MQNKILENPKAVCMLVEVIAKSSQNIPWKISLDGQSIRNNRIRRVSIDKFYELVTGEREAFKNLVEALPKVIDDILIDKDKFYIQNSVFKELKALDNNLLKSLYLLSFKEYEGFKNLNIK